MPSFASYLRGTGSKVRATQKAAQKAGLTLPELQIEAHILAGGNVLRCIEAMAFAKAHEIALDWTRVCALDLTHRDPLEVLQECVEPRESTLTSYLSNNAERIVGHCRDGAKVRCAITLSYRLPPEHIWGDVIQRIQERLATRACGQIYRSGSCAELDRVKSQHEAELLRVGVELVSTISAVTLRYEAE